MVWQPLNEIGKYGGTWRRAFTGPGGRRERQPHPVVRQAAELERRRQQDRALRRQGLRAQRRRQDLHAVPAQRHEVVRRRAVHRRRFHLLVRGHLRQSRDRSDADAGDAPAGQARPHGQGGRNHGALGIRRAVFPVRGHHGRRHGDGRRTGRAAGRQGQLRRLCARRITSSSSCRNIPRSRR